MSNSALVSHTNISPNRSSPRNHSIDTITIHCVVGQLSVETIGNIFKPSSRQASSNYGIGVDGRIGMYVEEKDRSWCSSSAANDNRAVTIEVASDMAAPYAVNAKAYAALFDLVTDICNRNGINRLVWSTSKDQRVNHWSGCNMTVHCDYANKSCPGDFLYQRHGEIAAEVNRRLGSGAVAAFVPAAQHSSSAGKLSVDGIWGPLTCKALQSKVGTPVDGIWGKNSQMALQQYLGVTADGWLGNGVSRPDGSQTITALQNTVGADADGIWGQNTVTKLQQWLNG